MLSIPDSILRNGLAQEAAGYPLLPALRAATVAEIARTGDDVHRACGPSCWRHEAQRWVHRISRARSVSVYERAADDCFRWAFREFQGSSSPLARDVHIGLSRGECPAHAVRRALLHQDRQRVQHNMAREWCDNAHRLRRPKEVLPFLAPYLTWGGRQRPVDAAKGVAQWAHDRIHYVTDVAKWGRPDYWQSPHATLASGSGDCEDSSLVVWSALPIVGLPEGRLVIGTMGGDGHAWVELPTLGLLIESTSGVVHPLGAPGYQPWMYAYPTGACALA